ncbi:MAG TPA: filamentous hemagglutinin N-terminal domain-containing protein, partial [Aquabacterium sp.]|uniref:two-partner secretion domain-containing protein n=1 Tax=Aquabacterium sp. TaxID=1872578 RepID=UPI002E35EE7C
MNRRASTLTAPLRRWGLRPVPAALIMALVPAAAWSFDLGTVTHGQATSTTTGTSTHVNVLTHTAITNTQDSSIRANESVVIDMLSSNSSLLIRDTSYDPTHLLGSLQTNGRVFFLNPNGIVFGSGFRADVGSLVASTLNLADEDFLQNKFRFTLAGSAGAIEQHGQIHASGTVTLIAPEVVNTGTIDASRVGLAAASEALVDLDGDGLVFLHVGNAQEAQTRLSQLGTIRADGGVAELQARAREGLAGTVLNMDGLVQARSIGSREGRIVIDGGSSGVTSVTGTLDASGQQAGEHGGQVSVLGDKVGLFDQAHIDASGQAGGGTVLVGGNWQGSGDERRASRTFVGGEASIQANALTQGDGGKVVVWSDEVTRFHGSIEAQGGAQAGNGGQTEVSGKAHLDFDGQVNLNATAGHDGLLLLDPQNITLVDTGGTAPANNASPTPDVAFGDSAGLDVSVNVSGVSGVAELRLQATQDITFATSLTMGLGNDVVLQAGRNIGLAGFTLRTTGSGTITLTAGSVDASGGISTGTGKIQASTGLVSLTAGTGGIIGNLDVDTVVLNTTGNVNVAEVNGLDLGTSTVGGNLTVTATSGNITDSGAVNVTGNASFTTNGNDA